MNLFASHNTVRVNRTGGGNIHISVVVDNIPDNIHTRRQFRTGVRCAGISGFYGNGLIRRIAGR